MSCSCGLCGEAKRFQKGTYLPPCSNTVQSDFKQIKTVGEALEADGFAYLMMMINTRPFVLRRSAASSDE